MKSVIHQKPSLEYRLKKRLTPLRKSIVYFGTERRTPLKLPLRTRWRAWRLGFTSKSYVLYDLDQRDPSDYLRDFSDINYLMDNPGAHTTRDKFQFACNMSMLKIPTPEVLALVDGSAIVWPDASKQNAEAGFLQVLTALLDENKRLVLRPTFGGAGGGVMILESRDSGIGVNGEPSTVQSVAKFLLGRGSYIVTPYIEQARYSNTIYPDALNTMRMLTIWDSAENEPVLVRAVHRFGSSRSFPMDHFHAGFGGVCAPVDLQSGKLGTALSLERDGSLKPFEQHPETGGQIAGVTIPFWNETVAMVLKAARHYATSPYIGWDIAVTGEGPSFIEANSPPGPAVMQVHAPLLEDERIRRFFREQGMI
ncbi:MAG: sugar-transfer associated ATP-grasp domain-containing protein [Lysobacterales bacterium]|jgi:hypothetical protein